MAPNFEKGNWNLEVFKKKVKNLRNYRNAEVAGELRVGEAAGANAGGEMRSGAGIAAVDGGNGGGVGGIGGHIV